MRQAREESPPQILEMLHIGLTNLPQQQAFQPSHPLAVIRTHLRQQPMALATTTSTTVTDCRRPASPVAHPRRCRCRQLPLLQDNIRQPEIHHLVARTSRPHPYRHITLQSSHSTPFSPPGASRFCPPSSS